MKKYIIRFWRENIQLHNGGYEKIVTIEVKNKKELNKYIKDHEGYCPCGSLRFIDYKEVTK